MLVNTWESTVVTTQCVSAHHYTTSAVKTHRHHTSLASARGGKRKRQSRMKVGQTQGSPEARRLSPLDNAMQLTCAQLPRSADGSQVQCEAGGLPGISQVLPAPAGLQTRSKAGAGAGAGAGARAVPWLRGGHTLSLPLKAALPSGWLVTACFCPGGGWEQASRTQRCMSQEWFICGGSSPVACLCGGQHVPDSPTLENQILSLPPAKEKGPGFSLQEVLPG